MNALGGYILTSLCFVIATMIELAVIIVVKRKLELKKKDSSDRVDGLTLKKIPRIFGKTSKVDVIEEMEQTIENERDGGIQGSPLEYKEPRNTRNQHGFWKELSTTDKVDMVSFASFLCAYFIFNCIYWGYYN